MVGLSSCRGWHVARDIQNRASFSPDRTPGHTGERRPARSVAGVESIAEGLKVPAEALLLGNTKIGVLFGLGWPTDPFQGFLGGVLGGENDAASYARSLSRQDRTDPETLRAVGDVLEQVDPAYDTRPARAGAAVGWLWGLLPGHLPDVTDEVTRDRVAAVVAGRWIEQVAL